MLYLLTDRALLSQNLAVHYRDCVLAVEFFGHQYLSLTESLCFSAKLELIICFSYLVSVQNIYFLKENFLLLLFFCI